MNDLIKINADSRLYVVQCGPDAVSTLGFDYAEKQRARVAAWLGLSGPVPELGTPEHYAAYQAAVSAGWTHHRATGARCDADLIPAFKGLEGRRLRVTLPDGETRAFWLGKSTGWMPCHLEINSRSSRAGMPVYFPAGSTFEVITKAGVR